MRGRERQTDTATFHTYNQLWHFVYRKNDIASPAGEIQILPRVMQFRIT